MSEPVQRPARSRAQNRQAWVERMQRFEQSGLSVVAFCREEQISAHASYYWRLKFQDTAPTSEGQAPRLLPVALAHTAPVELCPPCGAVLRLQPGCDLAFVRSLLDALEAEQC